MNLLSLSFAGLKRLLIFATGEGETMADLLKWLSGNPAALAVFFLAVLTVVITLDAVIVMVVLKGRPLKIWKLVDIGGMSEATAPGTVGWQPAATVKTGEQTGTRMVEVELAQEVRRIVRAELPESSRRMVQIGSVRLEHKPKDLYDGTASGDEPRTGYERVTFDLAFNKIPEIAMSLQEIDVGDPKDIIRLRVYAKQITIAGFVACFETWKESRLYNCKASWIAVGE
jgi:hypothetical protein